MDDNSLYGDKSQNSFSQLGKSKDEPILVLTKKKKLRPLPPIPRLPKHIDDQYSGLRGTEYPPILQTNSWTKSAPYKQEFTDLSPGENIGNHFSGIKYRMKELIRPPKPKAMRVHVDIKAFKAPPPALDKKYTQGICSYSIMPVQVQFNMHDKYE